MTTTASNPTLSAGLATLGFSRGVFTRMFESIPEEKLGQRGAGGAGNHALWILGHIATTDAQFLEALAGHDRPVPKAWDDLFGYKSEIKDDLSAYPSLDEVRAAFDGARAAITAWFESMDDQELAKPLPEGWDQFAPTQAALMSSLAVHEGMHAGQITCLRRELGLPLLMG